VPNQARDVSLNTNVVTHQDNKECKKTTALFPSRFFFSFFSFSFFALYFLGAKNSFEKPNNPNKGITAHNSFDNSSNVTTSRQ
jgi:hypothetical protein